MGPEVRLCSRRLRRRGPAGRRTPRLQARTAPGPGLLPARARRRGRRPKCAASRTTAKKEIPVIAAGGIYHGRRYPRLSRSRRVGSPDGHPLRRHGRVRRLARVQGDLSQGHERRPDHHQESRGHAREGHPAISSSTMSTPARASPSSAPITASITCRQQTSPYCIALALTNALRGQLKQRLRLRRGQRLPRKSDRHGQRAHRHAAQRIQRIRVALTDGPGAGGEKRLADMKIRVLGARGEIDESSPRHARHSGLLLDGRLLFDLGEREFLENKPRLVFITHLHPDHAFFVRRPAPLGVPVYAPETLAAAPEVKLSRARWPIAATPSVRFPHTTASR